MKVTATAVLSYKETFGSCWVNDVKPEANVNNNKTQALSRTTLRMHYKNQSVNAV